MDNTFFENQLLRIGKNLAVPPKITETEAPFHGHARCSECGMGEKQGHDATCSKIQRWTPQTARQRVGGTFGS